MNDGDRLLAFISIGHTGAIGVPAGWVEVPLSDNEAGATLQNRIYTKVASSEPASWTWTFTSAAYVGIAHVTRGVAGVFAAEQSDDGVSLLSHTTPVLPAPAGAWLVSSWTGRNLLALGWSAPTGDTERQDAIGGLLILLNVNHAVDDTAGPVTAGNYSKTALTLAAVRALDALVVLSPVLDPMVGTPVDGKGLLASATMGLGIIAAPITTSSGFGSHTMGMGLVGTPVSHPHQHIVAEIIPGEVVLAGVPFDTFAQVPSGQIIPGEVILGASPVAASDSQVTHLIIPGEITISVVEIGGFHDLGDFEIMLGSLVSPPAIPTYATLPPGTLGLHIGPGPIVPLSIPPPDTTNAYMVIGQPMFVGVEQVSSLFVGPCC